MGGEYVWNDYIGHNSRSTIAQVFARDVLSLIVVMGDMVRLGSRSESQVEERGDFLVHRRTGHRWRFLPYRLIDME